MTPVHLQLPLPPLGNHRNGLNLLSGRFYPTEETTKYRRLVQLSCVGLTPLEGLVAVGVDLYRHPGARGDVDNYLKCLLDHLQGAVYLNDSQIRRLGIEIHEDNRENEYVDVWLYPYAAPVGGAATLPAPPKRKRASLKSASYRPKKKEGA